MEKNIPIKVLGYNFCFFKKEERTDKLNFKRIFQIKVVNGLRKNTRKVFILGLLWTVNDGHRKLNYIIRKQTLEKI